MSIQGDFYPLTRPDFYEFRNQFCPGCGRQTASVWAGWKRMCMPNPEDSAEKKSPCISRKGLHNFNYPRTDPVSVSKQHSNCITDIGICLRI